MPLKKLLAMNKTQHFKITLKSIDLRPQHVKAIVKRHEENQQRNILETTTSGLSEL